MKIIYLDTVPLTIAHESVRRKQLIKPGDLSSSIQTLNLVELFPGESIPPHSHPDCEELYLFLTGSGLMTVSGNSLKVTKKHLITVNPGEVHELINNKEKILRFITVRIKVI